MLKESKTYTSFSVKDINSVKDFYINKLGLIVSNTMEDYALGFKTGGDTSFFVYPKNDHVPATYTVLNFVVEDLDKCVDELMENGVQMEQYPDMKTNQKGIAETGGGRMAWFKDPAGNILSAGTA